MLDNHPILKDRLTGAAVFTGIALGAVSGLELVVTGGFDFVTPGREIRRVAPLEYVSVVDTPWSREAVPLASNEPLFAGVAAAPAGALAGNGEAPAQRALQRLPSDSEIRAEIDALYAGDASAYQDDAEAGIGAEEAYVEEQADGAQSKDDVTSYETASPW